MKLGKHISIKGKFAARITLFPPDNRLIDIDNRVKAILDLAQHTGLIHNDNLCRLLVVRLGQKTPKGAARLSLRSL